MMGARETRFVQVDNLKAEIREDADNQPVLTGHAAVFDKWADIGGWFKEKIKRGAFAKTIQEQDVKCLWNHNSDLVMGRRNNGTLTLREDEVGLYFEAKPPQSAVGEIERIAKGYVNTCSFGFRVVKEDYTVGSGKELDERVLTEVRLYEISIGVPFPAYDGTDTAARSSEYLPKEINGIEIPDELRPEVVAGVFARALRGVHLCDEDYQVLMKHRELVERLIASEPERSERDHSDQHEPVVDHSLLWLQEQALITEKILNFNL